ncbi:MAG: STAS domain-containing protein [Thermoleophilia bacterium]
MIDDPSPDNVSRADELVDLGHLRMRSERSGDEHVIGLFGELDLAGADRVEEELLRIESSDVRSIVLDLSGLEFMDSTGVRLILAADARSRDDGKRLLLRRGPPSVQRVLQISGVEQMLAFAD